MGYIVNLFLKQKENEKASNSNTNRNDNNVVINNNVSYEGDRYDPAKKSEDPKKRLTRILFIDDNHTEYKMVSILKKSGWPNTKSVKDITDLEDPKIVESDIIFVDINGVGTTLFKDQGLGLASALKKKYPLKKIVIYSSETKGDRFHKALREVDDCLHKDAEPYQFINLIESFSK